MTNVPEVTDADREAAARCCQARDREEVAEAIARARAEERERMAPFVTLSAYLIEKYELGAFDGTDMHDEYMRKWCETAIRARGEGGKA